MVVCILQAVQNSSGATQKYYGKTEKGIPKSNKDDESYENAYV